MILWLLLLNIYNGVVSADTSTLVFPIRPPVSYNLTLPQDQSFQELTVCVWVVHSAVYIDQSAIVTLNSPASSLRILITRESLLLSVNKVVSPVYTHNPSPYKWYHICVSWSSMEGQFVFYLDGRMALRGSVSAGSELIGPLTLTMGAVTRYAFAGRLTHLQIYDRVLSQSEVTSVSCCSECSDCSAVMTWASVVARMDVRFLSEQTPCFIPPPSSVAVSLVSEVVILVKWRQLHSNSKLLKYKVILSHNHSANVITTKNNYLEIKALKPGTTYKLHVGSLSRCGVKELSSAVTIVTRTSASTIASMMVTGQTNTSISVAWIPPREPVKGYKTRVALTNTSTFWYNLIPAQPTYHTFTGLQPGTHYTISIAAINEEEGPFNTLYTNTTSGRSNHEVLATATILQDHFVNISWSVVFDGPEPNDVSYIVQIQKVNSDIECGTDCSVSSASEEVITVDGASVSFLQLRTSSQYVVIGGLLRHEEYQVAVGVCGKMGCGSFSNSSKFTVLDVEQFYLSQYYRAVNKINEGTINAFIQQDLTSNSTNQYSFVSTRIEKTAYFGQLSVTGYNIVPGEAWWLLRRAHDAQAPAHVHVEEVQLLEFVITPLHPAGYCSDVLANVSGKGVFYWPYVKHASLVTLPCHNDNDKTRSRRCEDYGWDEGDYSQCDYSSDTNGEMHRLKDSPITNVSEALTVATKLQTITDSDMDEHSVGLTSDIITHIVQSCSKAGLVNDARVAGSLVGCLDNVQALAPDKLGRASVSQDIIHNVEQYCLNIEGNSEVLLNHASDNLLLTVFKAPEDEEVSIVANAQEGLTLTQLSDSLYGKIESTGQIYIKIPSKVALNNILTVIYKDKRMFPGSDEDNSKIPIVSVTIAKQDNSKLKKEMSFILPINKIGSRTRVQCVYWDTKSQSWSSKGVKRVYSDDNSVICQSSHLTSFSALLLPDNDSYILSILSQIGAGVSMFCLMVTILLLSLVRTVRQQASTKLHLNLALSMLLALTSYMVNSNVSVVGIWCKILAVVMHYLFLTTFLWMGVEAAGLYRAVVLVFTTSSNAVFLITSCLIAWGVPLVVVTVLGVTQYNVYTLNGDLGMCWLSMDWMYASFLAPLALMMAFNLLIFIRVLVAIGGQKKQNRKGIVELRIIFSIMSLLGLTWVFGILQISYQHIVIQYMFALSNTLQGVAIFVCYCVFNATIRAAVWRLVKGEGLNPSNQYSASNNVKKKIKTKLSVRITHLGGTPFTFGESAESSSRRCMNRKEWNKLKKDDIKHTFNRSLTSSDITTSVTTA